MKTGTLAGACLLAAACISTPREAADPQIEVAGDSPIVDSIERVARETGVPAPLLAALAHGQTRFRMPGHGHTRSVFTILGLPEAELLRGAALAGVTDDAARTDVEAGLRAGAALLRDATPGARTLDDYLAALVPLLRRSVDRALARGVDARDANGRSILIAARPLIATGFGTITQGVTGYPGAEWAPASTANYDEATRDVGDISNVVIHTAQGSFDGTISWFQDPQAQVSSHYVVRSEDGHVVQMVSEKNIAWHDKCFNTRTIGIEHEGFIEDPELWYTEPMYLESAKLVSYLCDKYGIAKEYGAIVGHDAAPDCSTHVDPGPGWNWDHFISMVKTGGARFDATDLTVDAPATLRSGERATVVVTITNTGDTAWELDVTRLGTAGPQDRDSELFVDGDWLSPNRPTGIDARVLPNETGTFTFDIVGPEVTAPTVFAETFQVLEEGVIWFGPDIDVSVQVTPRGDTGGCNTSGGNGGFACMFAAGVLALLRRRRTRR